MEQNKKAPQIFYDEGDLKENATFSEIKQFYEIMVPVFTNASN